MLRSRLADLRLGASFLDDRRDTFPVTCLFMLIQAVSYGLLRLWQEGYVPLWIDFDWIWERSLLSLDAVREGRWYVLFTCFLVVYDLPSLLFSWAGLWVFGSAIEKRFGSGRAFLWTMLGAGLASGAFLLTSTWIEAIQGGTAASWQVEVVDRLRPNWRTYADVWIAAPLWWILAAIAFLRMPLRRALGFPMALTALAFMVLHVTGLFGYWTRQVTYDGLVATAALPLALFVITLPLFVLRPVGVRRRFRY